jgi:hypothetical protein
MRVQMKTKIGGYRDGVEWPAVGGTIDVPDHEAESLIANGYAAPASEETDDADQDAAELADDQGAQGGADGDAPADADGGGAADAGAEADTGDDAPAAVKPKKPAAKRVSAKRQDA